MSSSERTSRRTTLRWALLVVGLLFLGLVVADSLGAFSSTPYTAIPHGSHSHYVPNECEDVSAGDFPTQPPGPGERITCDGRVVPE